MYYYKARMYSPTLGRFLQTDPIGYEDNINLYAYVANDPINGIDFTGMEKKKSWFQRGIDFAKRARNSARRATSKTLRAASRATHEVATATEQPSAIIERTKANTREILTDAVDAVVPDNIYTSERMQNGETGKFTGVVIDRDEDGTQLNGRVIPPSNLNTEVQVPDDIRNARPIIRDTENMENRASPLRALAEALGDAADEMR